MARSTSSILSSPRWASRASTRYERSKPKRSPRSSRLLPIRAGWVADAMLWLAVGFTLFTGFQYVVDGRNALRSTGER